MLRIPATTFFENGWQMLLNLQLHIEAMCILQTYHAWKQHLLGKCALQLRVYLTLMLSVPLTFKYTCFLDHVELSILLPSHYSRLSDSLNWKPYYWNIEVHCCNDRWLAGLVLLLPDEWGFERLALQPHSVTCFFCKHWIDGNIFVSMAPPSYSDRCN